MRERTLTKLLVSATENGKKTTLKHVKNECTPSRVCRQVVGAVHRFPSSLTFALYFHFRSNLLEIVEIWGDLWLI